MLDPGLRRDDGSGRGEDRFNRASFVIDVWPGGGVKGGRVRSARKLLGLDYRSVRANIWLIRWLAFIPVAWQVGRVHHWILKLFGVPVSDHVVVVRDGDLLAWAMAGLITPLCVIAVGAWICPIKRKIWPVLGLSVVFIVSDLPMLWREAMLGWAWHPPGVGAAFTVSMSVAMSVACWWVTLRTSPNPSVGC